jgi:hypothetical protein
MNDVFIEKMEQRSKDNPSVQIEISIIPKNEEKKMNTNFKNSRTHIVKFFYGLSIM